MENTQTPHSNFSEGDIQELIKIHQKETGDVLSSQEAIEMGTRICNILREITQPIE